MFLLVACAENESPPSKETEEVLAETSENTGTDLSFFAMDTFMSVKLSSSDAELLADIENYVIELENHISTTLETSEISNINTNFESQVSEDTLDILTKAIGIAQRTNGVFDPTIYPIISAWGFTTDAYKIPTDAQIEELLPLVDYENIIINDDFVSINEGMKIDLGGIAKGYIADEITAMICEAGINSALLDLGGNVQAIGTKTDGSPWRVGIKNPDEGDVLAAVSVVDKAVVTSGGYERFFEGDDGEIYWHIMDPSTGKPAKNELISVTIIGKSGMYCDGLSTALFVMGLDGAIDFWRENDDFDTVLITEETIYVTEGIAENFTLLEDYKNLHVEYVKKYAEMG